MLKSSKQPYVFRASWRSTSKQFIVMAKSLDEANDKALTCGEARGATSITLIQAPLEEGDA